MRSAKKVPNSTDRQAAQTKNIAFFDFDGTITNRDSFIDFIIFYHGKWVAYLGLLRLLPFLLAYKVKLIPNWRAKEKVLTYFFEGEPTATFQQGCDQYATERIPPITRVGALQALQKHHDLGNDIYLVSASPENWLSAWCQQKGIKLIASRLEVIDDKLTGKLRGNNCYGAEKVARIHQEIDLSDYEGVYAYGDSSGDREMLRLADYAYYRPFR
ncbi:HAD-IB family hydrolase [Tunicatimonas pelagia]|uniref:HAD-IB family hydrolase n=1 Tax=Tunicatimonas pelagia TaxID=931531 RepID=UPI0026659AA3|nr:HAD-IB family hydrolase [Tunicatimonas pelagia]WKN42947.1 HAD-IB family hydrolase [Tunicatimonas pelagia]